MNKTITKKIITTIATSTVVLLALAACTSNGDMKQNTDEIILSFSEPIELSKAPEFDIENIKFIGGWSTKEDVAEDGSISIQGVATSSYIELYNSDDSCRFSASSIFSEAWKAPRGELYNSKDRLYSLNYNQEAFVTDENSISSKTSEGKLEMAAAKYVNDIVDMKGNLSSDKSYNKSAVRAFTNLLSTGYEQVEGDSNTGQYNTDITKGIPVLEYTLSCNSEDALTDELWNELTNSIKVNLSISDSKK